MPRALWNTRELAGAQTGSWLSPSFPLLPFQHCFSKGQFLCLPTLAECQPSTGAQLSLACSVPGAEKGQHRLGFIFCTHVLVWKRGRQGQTPSEVQESPRAEQSHVSMACHKLLCTRMFAAVRDATNLGKNWLVRGTASQPAPSSGGSVAGYTEEFLLFGIMRHPGQHHTFVGEETALSRMVLAFSAVVYLQN